MFRSRIDRPGSTTKTEWIQMVKQNAVFGPDKLLRPKPT
jgi:transcription initiation factor TFIIF subunit alpha